MTLSKKSSLQMQFVRLSRIVTARIWRGFGEILRASGVTWPQFLYLRALYAGKVDTPSGIAESFGVDAGSITRLMDRLERGGFLRRCSRKGDRRVVRLELTASGRKIVENARPLARAHASRVCEGLSEAELESLVGLLRRLAGPQEKRRAGESRAAKVSRNARSAARRRDSK